MSPAEVDTALLRSAGQVLETMCYSDLTPITGIEEGQPLLSAELRFHGTRSGAFHLDITEDAGKYIASAFLGDGDEVPLAQVGSVLCELTNMICGSLLSALDTRADIELDAPRIVAASAVAGHGAMSRAFEIDNGQMAVSISFS